MKNPQTPTEKPTPKAKNEQAIVAVASEAKTKTPSPTPKTPKQPTAATPKPVSKAQKEPSVSVVVAEENPKKTSPAPKSPKKTQVVASKPVVTLTEIAPSERVGLTAGITWPIMALARLQNWFRNFRKKKKTIQRSIGWLAQEGKITFDTFNRVETIGLTG